MEFRLPGVPPADLVDLYQKRALSEKEYQSAIEWATKPPPRDRWAVYLRDWFLIFGVLLLVSGVVVFGAYNWPALHRFAKLGILQMLVLGAWAGSRLRPVDSKESTALLWGASLLVGALLAVFGQIYQTGADAYTLFLTWAALIVPWCLAGRSNLLWFTQAALVSTTFSLYWTQVINDDFAAYSLGYAALNALLAFAWEKKRLTTPWMKRGITDSLIANGLTPLTAAGCASFWEGDTHTVSLLVNVALLLVLWRRYGGEIRKMALVACSAVTLVGSLTIRVFSELDELGFLLIAAALIAEITVMAAWLRKVNASLPSHDLHEPEEPGGPPRPSVIQVLAENGLLDETPPPAERKVERATPVYVSCLTAMGAWIASWFFLVFVAVGVSDSESSMIVFGVALWAATIFVRRRLEEKSEFLAYGCLAVNMAGQLMATIGVASTTGSSSESVAATALVLQLIALVLFKDSLGRAMFAFASVISGGTLFWLVGDSQGMSLWLLLIAFLVSRLLIGQRGWLLSRWRYWHGAVAFGWCFGLLTAVSFWGFARQWGEWGVPQPEILAIGLTLLAAGCAVRLQAPASAVVALLALGAFTFTMPGLMAATLVFILAFHTRSLSASWLSVLALLLFGVLYYYNLDLSFLAKSATLIGSGLLLLVARSSLRPQGGHHAF